MRAARTGIGLAAVKRIAARHGGTVGAHRHGPGRGATLWFTLGTDGLSSPLVREAPS